MSGAGIVVCCLAVAALASPVVAPAHAEGTGAPPLPTPGDIALRAIASDLESLETFQADFVQTQEWVGLDPSEPFRGTLSLRKPNLFRIEYSQPPGHLQISDGKMVWTWIPENGEVLRADLQQSGSAGGDLLRWILRNSSAAPDVVEEKVSGSAARLVTLKPGDGLGLSQVRIWTRPGSAAILQYEVTDAGGNRTVYRLEKTRRNPRLAADLFHFDPPPGVPVVDVGAP